MKQRVQALVAHLIIEQLSLITEPMRSELHYIVARCKTIDVVPTYGLRPDDRVIFGPFCPRSDLISETDIMNAVVSNWFSIIRAISCP